MEAVRVLMAGGAISAAALGAANSLTNPPEIIRPGPCAGEETYLLAGNSGAIIRITRSGPEEDRVIVFREQPSKGWASRRLLRRFDLKLDEAGPDIVNSGRFCRGAQ